MLFHNWRRLFWMLPISALSFCFMSGCAGTKTSYVDDKMDFSSLRTVAVLPFANLSRETSSSERVRDSFSNRLIATGSLYVLPDGEVNRGLTRSGVSDPKAPAIDEIKKLCGLLKADAVITGVVREYGEVRSGSSVANVVSLSLRMLECQAGIIVWTGESTKGGISFSDRLLGGGGQPMNRVTEQAVDELVESLLHD